MSSRRPGGTSSSAGSSSSKLRMDRQPAVARISDPSLPIGRRKEIDSVMKKARGSNNGSGDYWDKKLLDIEEKDPNRWRHSGFKKMYLDESPEHGERPRVRERERERERIPPRAAEPPPHRRPRSPRSPPRELHRRRSPPPPPMDKRSAPAPMRSTRRPPSPPPKFQSRHRSKSSDSSYSGGELYHHSQHSNHHPAQNLPAQYHNRHRSRSRSVSIPRSRVRSTSSRDQEHHRSGAIRSSAPTASGAVVGKRTPLDAVDQEDGDEDWKRHGKRAKKSHVPPEDPRLARQQANTAVAGTSSTALEAESVAHKKRVKGHEKLRARVKIEGEKRRKKVSSSESEDSSSSESADESIPTFAATTRMTLSERFGKMAQWSADRSHMEHLKTMRITSQLAHGGPMKVMIEEQAVAATVEDMEPPPRREYSPAPAGHFPEELALTAPSGLMSWDDVRVRYEYYKARGYLRDLDLQDYVKWEEWWYKYQEWLKQERYYEFWERQQLRRRRKKVPIAQRLN